MEEVQDIRRILSVRRSLGNIIIDPEKDSGRDKMIRFLLSRMAEIFDERAFQHTLYRGGRKGGGSISSADFRTGDLAVWGSIDYKNYDIFYGLLDIQVKFNRSFNRSVQLDEQYSALKKLLKID